MSESVPFVSTPTHPPVEGSLMHWAQTRLNSIHDAGKPKTAGEAKEDAFDHAFGKDVRIMLNMRPATREQLRARTERQRDYTTRVVQDWYGSLEVVDKGSPVDHPTGLFTGFRHVTRIYEEREGYTPIVHQLWSSVQIRVVHGPRESRGTRDAEDSRRIAEYWETEIDTQEITSSAGQSEKETGDRPKA